MNVKMNDFVSYSISVLPYPLYQGRRGVYDYFLLFRIINADFAVIALK